MKDSTILGITGIAAVVIVELYALYLGIDGTVLSLVIAALAGLGGYQLSKTKGAVAPAVIGFSFELDTMALTIFAIFGVVAVFGFMVWRISRMPGEFAYGLADSLTDIAGDKKPDPEAYAHLNQTISEAIRTRSWEPLVGLVANPIFMKAMNNLKPALARVMTGQTPSAYREFAAGD